MRVGYLASHYPAVSHAFILREVRALRRAGVEVETFSLHRARSSDVLAEADRDEAERTFSARPIGAGRLLGVHLKAFFRAPVRYLGTLGFALGNSAPGARGRLWSLFYFAEAMVVWDAAEARGVRHLHAVFADSASDAAMIVARYGGPGWTWSLAAHGPVEFYDVSLNRLRTKLAAANFAVAISHFGRSQLMTLTPEHRWPELYVVRCGLEPNEFPAAERARSPRDEPQILCVGRLVNLKGQSLLIAACAELVRQGRPVQLTLVGEGPKRTELEAQAGSLGLGDRVRFTGAVGQDDIRALYSSADVFCLPSFAEGLPVVLMEAMASGVPVVSTRIMGIPELVEDGENGLLVAPGEVDPLAEALSRLLDDREFASRLAARGRERVLAEFDVNASARRLAAVFESHL
jgi:colanic acid/amylovoran biosynthesis glycosyltransferase